MRMNESKPQKPKPTMTERLRDEGVLPPWWGFILFVFFSTATYLVLYGWFPLLVGAFHGMSWMICVGNLGVSFCNAIYGIIRKKLTTQYGRDLLFLHFASAFLMGVLLWSGHWIWAWIVSFISSPFNGKECLKNETPTDSTVQ